VRYRVLNPEAIAARLAEDIAFSSPIHTKLLRGEDRVLELFDHAERLLADLTYYDSAADDELTILFSHGESLRDPSRAPASSAPRSRDRCASSQS
jgi:hypothetical protein